MRRVYIQSNDDGTHLSQNTFIATKGFKSFGYEVLQFKLKELSGLELQKDDIVIGYIGTVQQALEQLGVSKPLPIQPPDELLASLKRKIWKSTLGEVRKLDQVPLFIKPLYGSKSFTGHVIVEFKDLIKTNSFESDFEIMVQEALDISSEWRVYVLRNDPIGIAQYSGSPLSIPNGNFIRETIEQYASPPVAYGIDFAVTESGETVLLEINDAYGIGNYGLVDYQYARLLEARWDELVSTL